MRRKLSPGDVVIYRAGSRRMRALVAACSLELRARGEELMVAIQKRDDGRNIHWLPRSKLRKAPGRRSEP